MDKIASPQELASQLRHLLAYAQSPKPSRVELAADLKRLARLVTIDEEAWLLADDAKERLLLDFPMMSGKLLRFSTRPELLKEAATRTGWADKHRFVAKWITLIADKMGSDDIPVGEVISVRKRDFELFQQAVIQPTVDITNLDIILIITNFRPFLLDGSE